MPVISIKICVWPEIKSTIAGAEPLYGTWVSLMPPTLLSNSPFKWVIEPLPPEAKLALPGFFFAHWINVFSESTGSSRGTTARK